MQIIIGTILGTEEDPIDLTHENSKKILEIIRRNLKHQDDPDDIELDLTEIKERYESSDQSVKDKILLESQIKLFSLSKKLSTQEESAALQIYSIAQSIDQDKIRQKQLDVLRGEVFEGKHGKIEEKLLPTFRELLGLEESSSIQEVQKAYNGAHPDIKEKINLEIKFRFKILAIDDPVGLPKKGDERYEALKKAPNNPLSSEEIISVLKTDPALKEKVELEVKLSQRAGFQQHAQKLEGQTGEQRYDTLRAINRHENRQYSQEFIQQQFTEQEQSMAGQKEALAQFRKELLRKSSTIFPSSRMADNEVFRDLTGTNPTFPISPHGVARSLKYTGAAAGGSSSRTTKIAKISFNSPEGEDIKEEDNEQFIQIPGTNFYKRVVRIPAGKRPEGSSAFYYKDGVKKEIETSNEERILIDENTAWRMTKVRIPDSNPPKFATKPVPYKMFNSRGHPSSALKRDITHSMLPFITRGYKNLGIESISMENGQVKAMSYQRAGSRNVTTTVTQNDVAKSMLAGEQKIIADLMKKSKSGGGLTEEESATLASTIATHEENLNRLSKRGVATTKYVNALIKAMGGEEKLDRVYEVNDRMGMVAEDEMKRITPILKNPTLRELDGHVTTTNQRPSIQQFRRQLARYAVMTANQMVTKSGRENFLAKIFTLANDALSKNTVELDRDQFNKDLLKEIKDYARASGDKRSKLWITNPGKWLPRGFRKIEKDRVDNALTKVPEEQKTTFRLEQNVINTLRNHNRVNTLESYGEFRNAMTKLENDIQVRFAGSSKYESSIKRMFPSIPYVRDGAEVSRTDAVKHLGKIFDSLFSRDMRTLFQDEEVSNRPDVKEFSRSVARYAVETAQGLLSSSGRKETLEGILKLANDELTKHGIVVDTEQFTDQLTSNISAYAAARSGESYRYSPLGRRTGYNATGGSRLTAAAEGFASEDGGRILSEEENKCLQIILNSSIIAVEPGDLDVIRELPVTSIARVIQGYQAAMDEEVTTIKPPKTIKDTDPPNEPYEILKKQIFEEGRDFGTDPIDLTNPVDLLKTRQYEYEAAKLIAQTAKSRFSREKTEEVKRIGYKMTGGRAGTYEAKGRNPFIDTEIENATEALVGMADDTISTQITELVGQHALDKKEKAGILKPSHPKTRYGNIAAKTGSTETTEKKWTKRIKQRDTGEVGDGGREAG